MRSPEVGSIPHEIPLHKQIEMGLVKPGDIFDYNGRKTLFVGYAPAEGEEGQATITREPTAEELQRHEEIEMAASEAVSHFIRGNPDRTPKQVEAVRERARRLYQYDAKSVREVDRQVNEITQKQDLEKVRYWGRELSILEEKLARASSVLESVELQRQIDDAGVNMAYWQESADGMQKWIDDPGKGGA